MAVQFAATDNHLDFQTTLGAISSPSSVCFWAYFSTALTTTQSLVSITATSGTASSLGTTTGGIQCGALAGQVAMYTFNTTTAIISTATAPALNAWCHVCFTWDGTTNTVYLNGVSSKTSTTARPTSVANTIFFNGYPGGTAAQTSSARMDDMRIYGRALSAAEVMTVYTLAGLRDGITYSMAVCSPFDGPAGASATGTVERVSGIAATATGSGATACTYAASTLSMVRSRSAC